MGGWVDEWVDRWVDGWVDRKDRRVVEGWEGSAGRRSPRRWRPGRFSRVGSWVSGSLAGGVEPDGSMVPSVGRNKSHGRCGKSPP